MSSTAESMLVFTLAQQKYAFAVTHVREVIPIAALIPVPEAPKGLIGLLRLRGTLLPIVDLRERLGLLTVQRVISQRIVVAFISQAPIGLVVDSVLGLTRILEERISSTDRAKDQLIRRTFETPEGIVTLLNTEKIPSADLYTFLSSTLDGWATSLTARQDPTGYLTDSGTDAEKIWA